MMMNKYIYSWQKAMSLAVFKVDCDITGRSIQICA